MKATIPFLSVFVFTTFFLWACRGVDANEESSTILLRDLTLIDGNGGKPREHIDILIQGDTIADIGSDLDTIGHIIREMENLTAMPLLISTHVHVGTVKGTTSKAENYTRSNILQQLIRYRDYGIGSILVMGTDRPLLFESGLRDSSLRGQLPGTRLYSTGYGFGVPTGAPPIEFGMDHVFRPSSPDQVPLFMDSLMKIKPELVKIWVDDFGGKYKKMDPAIYTAIIKEAHEHQLRVAAHAYYLADARKLIDAGVDIIAHSIRDSLIDDKTVMKMKERRVSYIPTLSLDEFAYIYARKPDWLYDPFFKGSLQPGVYETIVSEKYQQALKNSSAYLKNVQAFAIALRNLEKLYHAGIWVALGTDSGATPIRAQGFSEHLELELMVQAGLTPLEAIGIGTKNSATLMGIIDRYGTIEKGKVADILIVNGNPADNILDTRKIYAVYKAGHYVSNGPIH